MNFEHLDRVRLRPEIDRRINFAMQQNDVTVVKAVHVENLSNKPLRDLHLCIIPEPQFAEPWKAHIDLIGEDSIYNLEAVDLVLSPRYLSELTEQIKGQLRFDLFSGQEHLVESVETVILLARDEWSGLTSLPEILAAFVMPNHPAVEHLLRKTSDILRRWSEDPSLAGYQRKDPKHVFMMAAAIYSALQHLGITYINPPASFEAQGQRIRLPDRIVESKMATCLDLAVLGAGCLEQAGLNPLIVVVQGHAFVGVWLQEECFSEPAIDEPLRLRKRVDLGEIVVFDPTCVTNSPSPDFKGSIQEAKRHLYNPDEFLCVIDLARARKGRIRPLPERVERQERAAQVSLEEAAGEASPTPDISDLPIPSVITEITGGDVAETPATRLDRWCRRLLDLSLRNRLLNFRQTKKTIPLFCPDLTALENALADGATFHILSRPADLGERDPRDPDAYRRRTGEEATAALLRDELRSKRLHADLATEELDRRLLDIYRTAKLDLEEGGASALYLAIGFLAWYESPQSSQARLAPILLLPIALHRKSSREGFTFKLGDDELHINVTLLELLRQDHGIHVPGLDPLPEDDSGVDVAKILRTFRETIRDIDRWDVFEIAQIGIFSFAKFLMWRDLKERTEDLMKNPVVGHLVNHPDQEFEPEAIFPNPDHLDEERSPLHTYCPLPADASQLAAVFAAADGRSFVLEGPPGTGKSQTITNLIAHCLAEGKTVLFVSEKMAALNVVHDRLLKIKLGRYCLELHSNKTNKRDVLRQLSDAINHIEVHSPDGWAEEAQNLKTIRNYLNAYVEALHKQRNTGETVFQATSRLIGLRNVPLVDLRWSSPDNIDKDQLIKIRDLIERLATVGAALGEVPGHPWQAVRRSDWTPAWEQEVHVIIDKLRKSINALEVLGAEASAKVSFKEGGWSLNDLDLLNELTEILLNSPAPPIAILVQPDWDEISSRIGIWIGHGLTRDALRNEVYERFSEKILSLDLDILQKQFEQGFASRWPISWWRLRPVRKALKSMAKDKKAPAKEELSAVLENISALYREEQALSTAGDDARALLGRYWNDGEAEWDRLKEVSNWTKQFRSLAARAAGENFEQAAYLREHWAQLSTEGLDLLKPDGSIGRVLLAYHASYKSFLELCDALGSLLDLDTDLAWGQGDDGNALPTIQNTLLGWSERGPQLRDWCAWRRAREEAISLNLLPLVEAYEAGDCSSGELNDVFNRSYYYWWHTSIVSSEPVLAQFFSPDHERNIQKFRDLDKHYLKITRDLVKARLGEKVPASGAVDLPNSQVGILKRQIGMQRRQMSVRKLFQTIPDLLPRLKPCLLMSPMSVAQYLDASYPPFDIIVFDEASQIPVWDAVGAIARGKQAIIVGDPKQLPPTSFFQRQEDDEEEPTEAELVEDLESILDDCISARLTRLSLNWHYRSRHESLIAFSNYHYYNNRLLTFPSPHRQGMGVSWRHVPEGIYDRGKSATNRAEAEVIVKEIVRRLKDNSSWSIGVVTFSQAQQTLIEDLLEKVRRSDPKVDGFFAEGINEPVFVKNLENVQGDERDVILFSICYGPDSMGRVSMNFGPMNREGGERRLNVAITRARREVIVFSTLRADQIDLARTRAPGVRDLKNFLEYAEHGPSAIAEAVQYDPEADFDSPFEKDVYEVLVNKGWKVHQQVGCARYRIDLAVVNPEAPGRYLLGIECDGANYHRAKTARDRDKLREGVLKELGWKLHRIWSTDWWTNPEKEIQKIEAALEDAQRIRRERGTRAEITPTVEPRVSSNQQNREPLPSEEERRHPIYSPLKMVGAFGQPNNFYEPTSKSAIRRLIADVVRHEWPITLGLTARRVAAYWGIRVTNKAQNWVRTLLPSDDVLVTTSEDDILLWPKGTDPDAYDIFRVPGRDSGSLRKPEDLPIREVANAALFILKQNVSAPEDEIVRGLRYLFGFRRTGPHVEKCMRAGVALLIRKGLARREGTTVILEEK